MPELASAGFSRKAMEHFRFLDLFFSQRNGAFSLFALFSRKAMELFRFLRWFFSLRNGTFSLFALFFRIGAQKFHFSLQISTKAHKITNSCVLLFVFSTKSDKFLHFLLYPHNQVSKICFMNRLIARYSLNHTDGYNSH